MNGPRPIYVAHVIHHLVIGGMENGVVNLINRLPRERYRHVVICIEDYSDFRRRIQRDDVEVYAMHRSKTGIWRLRWAMLRLLRRLRPDIVHSRNMSGLDALLPARLAGCATVHSEHGFDVDDLQGRAFKPALLRRLHAPLVQHYVAVSKDLASLIARQAHVKKERITQIYNGVDTELFCPGAPGAARAGLPWPELDSDSLVVGTVGRLRPVKDQGTLIRAVAELAERRSEYRRRLKLVLVGDGPLLEPLRALVAEQAVTDLVWFAGASDKVARVLQSMDVFVLPSLNEGISNTLLEAMASALPVLATAVGGNVELVERGVVGEMFAAGDVHALADLIEQYMNDPGLRVRQGRAARELVLRKYSLDAMVANYRAVYEQL